MFAYIDEAGHTGKNLSDPIQKEFYTLGMVSKYNIDIMFKDQFDRLCHYLHVDELHAVEMGENIEAIAEFIILVFRKASPCFSLCIVEKEYLAIAKLFDTIFDSYENIGARSHVYNVRPLRLLLLGKLCFVTPIKTAIMFYEKCLFAQDQKEANDTLIEVCNEIIDNLSMLPDQRSKELIGDALNWAKSNPSAITTYNTRREDRWKHLPNIVTFLPMLDQIARIAKRKGANVNKIIHDEQQQMRNNFLKMHQLVSDRKRPDIWDMRDNGYYLLANLKDSVFEMKSSKSSPGIQIVDICLYVFTHRDYIDIHKAELPNSFLLLAYIAMHGSLYDFFTGNS